MNSRARILILLTVSTCLIIAALVAFQLRARQRADPNSSYWQSQKEDVIAAYRMQEQAIRTRDGELWLRLMSRKLAADPAVASSVRQRMKQGSFADASDHTDVVAARIEGPRAVVIGRRPSSLHFDCAIFEQEDGEWKCQRRRVYEAPLDAAAAAYVLLPPEGGTFSAAGAPWHKIPYQQTDLEHHPPADQPCPWKMQAIRDDVYLYLRFSGESPLPAPGSEAVVPAGQTFPTDPGTEGPGTVRVATYAISGNKKATEQEVEVSAEPVVEWTRGNRYAVQYVMYARDRVRTALFDSSTADGAHALIAVQNGALELRIPLKALGAQAASGSQVEIRGMELHPKVAGLTFFGPFRPVARYAP